MHGLKDTIGTDGAVIAARALKFVRRRARMQRLIAPPARNFPGAGLRLLPAALFALAAPLAPGAPPAAADALTDYRALAADLLEADVNAPPPDEPALPPVSQAGFLALARALEGRWEGVYVLTDFHGRILDRMRVVFNYRLTTFGEAYPEEGSDDPLLESTANFQTRGGARQVVSMSYLDSGKLVSRVWQEGETRLDYGRLLGPRAVAWMPLAYSEIFSRYAELRVRGRQDRRALRLSGYELQERADGEPVILRYAAHLRPSAEAPPPPPRQGPARNVERY